MNAVYPTDFPFIICFYLFYNYGYYISLIMLLQLYQFFPLCPPPLSNPHFLRQSPHHCSCPRVTRISFLATPFPVLCFTSPWLFCNYLPVLLNPLNALLLPLHPCPIWQPSKHSLYPWFCLCFLSLFFRFNCWYVFIAILVFKILIVSLNKSL